MRYGLAPMLGRIAAIIATLLVLGITLRLLGEILTIVLPQTFLQALSAGWQRIYLITGSAMSSIVAMLIVGALIWIIIGKRR